jgi:hypothetical protein
MMTGGQRARGCCPGIEAQAGDHIGQQLRQMRSAILVAQRNGHQVFLLFHQCQPIVNQCVSFSLENLCHRFRGARLDFAVVVFVMTHVPSS